MVIFNNGEGPNSILSGFTIIGDMSYWGILVSGTSPLIYNNIIRNHEVGIRVDNGAPSIRENEITLCSHSDLHPANGGGIRMVGSNNAVIDSNVIHHNIADVAAGIFLQFCTNITVERNLIYSNSSQYIGGLEIVDCGNISVYNNTFVDNASTSNYILGSINFSNSDGVTVINNISVFNNEYGICSYQNNINVTTAYNDVYGNSPSDYRHWNPGTGSISADPLFFDQANDLYFLDINSPCINTGDPAMPYDPDGTIADMGALFFDSGSMGYGILAGTVTDIDEADVENVHVDILNGDFETWTDANGEYLIENLPGWVGYDILFSHPDYAEVLVPGVTVPIDDTFILDIVLEYPGWIAGTVLDEIPEPIEGVYVEAVGTSASAYTDVNGEYTLNSLNPGIHNVYFSHDNYRDTIITDVSVTAGETTILDLEMEVPCSYIVGDANGTNAFNILDPIFCWEYLYSGNTPPTYLCECTDGYPWFPAADANGDCFFNSLDPQWMVAYLRFQYENIAPCPDCPPPGWPPYPIPPPGFHNVSDDDNLILTDEGVEIWFGNPDGSPIGVLPGQPAVVNVYMQTASDVNVTCFNLPLAADNQYITGFTSETEGHLFDNLAQWYIAEFLSPEGSPPNEDGWTSQSLVGIRDIIRQLDLPFLHYDTPTRIATFVLEIVNDPELIGDTVECIGPGINSRNGPAVFGDSAAIVETELIQHFSSLIFLDPENSQGSLAGTASDNASLPIEGVTVSIAETDLSDITDADGEYFIGDIIQGTYDIVFTHTAYCDTIRSSILIFTDEITTLDVVLSDAGNLAGAATDSESNTLEGVAVSVFETGYSDITDSNGDYQITGLCPGLYDVSFVHPGFATITVTDVSIIEGETTIIDVVMWPAALDEVVIWYGNPYGQPIIAPIGDTLLIDVYAQTLESIYITGMFLPLGSEDQYISQRVSADNGQVYYPLTDWDEARFTEVHGSPPNQDGWSNESLMGIADYIGPPNPLLHSETPLKFATFVVVTADDPSLDGQTINCLGPGSDPVYGGPGGSTVDSDGQWISTTEIYCPIFFTSTFTGSIAGVVSDTEANPIQGVTATAIGTGISDITDALGEYLLDELNPGTYNISFSHPDYSTSYVNGVEVAIGLTTTVNVTLYPAGACEYIVGDYNGNGSFNVADIIAAFSKLKIGSPEPAMTCECPPGGDEWAVAMDLNNSCGFNVADVIAGFSKLKIGAPDLIPCELCPPSGGSPAPGDDDRPAVIPSLKSKVKGDNHGRSD